jgi:hypothetical protein
VEYTALTQSIIQLTKIIAVGVTDVKTVPSAPSASANSRIRDPAIGGPQ